MVEASFLADGERYTVHIDARFQGDEVEDLLPKTYFGLDGGDIGLNIPRELEKTVDRFSDSNDIVRIFAEPFVQCYVHPFRGTLDVQEEML